MPRHRASPAGILKNLAYETNIACASAGGMRATKISPPPFPSGFIISRTFGTPRPLSRSTPSSQESERMVALDYRGGRLYAMADLVSRVGRCWAGDPARDGVCIDPGAPEHGGSNR